MLIAHFLKLAVLWNSQSQPELRAPGFDFAQKMVHFHGIQIGGMPRFSVSGFLSDNEVGIGDLHTVETGSLEVAFNPFRRRVGTPGFDEILTDFGVPHVAEAVLRNAVLLAPGLYLEAIALTIVKNGWSC